MTELEHEAACRAVIDETALLLDAADNAGWDAAVPSCPEWTVTDLVVHLGRGQRQVAEIVTRGADAMVPLDEVEDTDPGTDPTAVRAWATASAAHLHHELADAGEDRAVWTPGGSGTSRDWGRRMAHEAVLHRMDAQLAAGGPVALTCSTPELHADGVTAALEMLAGRGAGQVGSEETTSLHVHATDDALGDAGEWVVHRGPDGVRWEHGHEKADVAVRGRVHLLQALLARRIGPDDERLELHGDSDALEGWIDLTAP